MKNFAMKTSVFALIVMMVIACKEDEEKPGTCENGTFQATINGQVFTATSFNNTLVVGTSAGSQGKRMDIRATGPNNRQLIITLSDLTSDPNTNGVTTDAYISFDEVMTGTENSFLFTILDGNTNAYSFIEGSLDITSCDPTTKQVSGTFSFSDDEFQVTNGSFTNMCYSVMK